MIFAETFPSEGMIRGNVGNGKAKLVDNFLMPVVKLASPRSSCMCRIVYMKSGSKFEFHIEISRQISKEILNGKALVLTGNNP